MPSNQRDNLALIGQIADGLLSMESDNERCHLNCVEVVFFDEDGAQLSAGSLGCMLNYLVEDIHTDGDCNDISGAVRAAVRTM